MDNKSEREYFVRLSQMTNDSRVLNESSLVIKELLIGTFDHYCNLERELFSYFHTSDLAELNRRANIAYEKFLSEDKYSRSTQDMLIFNMRSQFNGAISSLCGENYSEFVRLFGLSCKGFSERRQRISFSTKLPKFELLIRKQVGKAAVSHRGDQILKINWQQHVRQCVEAGHTINNLKDLLDVEGYDEKVCQILPTTLKSWAKEAVPSLKFKSGRPK